MFTSWSRVSGAPRTCTCTSTEKTASYISWHQLGFVCSPCLCSSLVTRPSVFILLKIGFSKHDMILVNNDMEYSGGAGLSSETVRANLGCRSSLLPVRSTSGHHQLKIFKSDSSSESLIFLKVILEVRWVEALCEAPSFNFSGTSRRFLTWTNLLVLHKIMLL